MSYQLYFVTRLHRTSQFLRKQIILYQQHIRLCSDQGLSGILLTRQTVYGNGPCAMNRHMLCKQQAEFVCTKGAVTGRADAVVLFEHF